MNQTIRKRIEDINNGIVPEGYKQTPFGIFPCDWETKNLSYGVDIIDGDRGKEYPKETDFSDTGYCLFLNAGNVTANGFCFKNNQFIAEEKCNKLKKGKLALNDIVITTRGTVGNFAMFSQQIPYRHMRINSGMAIIKTKGRFDLGYLFCSLKSYMIKNQIKKICFGSAQPQLTIPSISRMQIAFPKDKTEQGKIAEILMKWDEMVELQEQYIQKLELRKKAIMKKLLTPKDGWMSVLVKDIFEITRGQVLPTSACDNSYQYPVYSSQTTNNGLMGYYHEYLFEDCITWTTDGANAGEVKFRKGKFYCTNVCGVLKSVEGFANECVAYIINSVSKSYVSYVGNPKLMNNTMGNIKLLLPTIEEQMKFSHLIDTMDEEIFLQKEKLEKIKEQRKAMQQYLLTGIVRV